MKLNPRQVFDFFKYRLLTFESILGAENLQKPRRIPERQRPLVNPSAVWAIRAGNDLEKTHAIAFTSQYVVVTGRRSGSVVVFDASSLSSLEHTATITGPKLEGAHGLTIQDNYGYVTCEQSNRVTVIDFSDVTEPQIISSVRDTEKLNLVKRHDYCDGLLYCAVADSNALSIVDVSTVEKLSVVGSVSDDKLLKRANDAFYRDGYAYVSANRGQYVIVDVDDPTEPVIVGSADSAYLQGNKNSVVDSRGIAYVAAKQSDALTTVDVSDPKEPTVLDSFSNPDFTGTQAVALDDPDDPEYAYVTNRRGMSFVTIDVSDPANLTRAGCIDSFFDLRDPQYVCYKDGLAYIAADGSDSLTIIG